MKIVNELIKSAAGKMGIQVRRKSVATDPTLQLFSGLQLHGIDYVIDVGANRGQFACLLREQGYVGKILSFEPLPSAFVELSKKVKRDSLWEAMHIAVGSRDESIGINVSQNSVSSSILEITKAHTSVAEESRVIETIMVDSRRLDGIISIDVVKRHSVFLKIDTQGYEWEVLQGAAGIMPWVKGVVCELSLLELYKGQKLWREVVDILLQQGFQIWALQKGFTDQITGRTLQFNAVFFRVQ